MLLRVEDTDQTRFVPGAEEYIFEALGWLGIRIDEGVREGGPHAPYRQSERKPMYRQYAERLVAEGNAYYAFDTNEELDAMRERLVAANVPNQQYNAVTRMQMRNSLTLSEDEVKELIQSGTPYTVRLKVPRKEEVRLHDLIRGWVMVHSSTLDDKVLLKSDGMPTYHLANVVDDHLMNITHVIRGEEWLPSAPLHVLLYRFLGWEATMPQFVHLPLLLNPDGNGKLSKRFADKYGFPVFPLNWNGIDAETGKPMIVQGFREAGYLPEALINFLALQGWNPGTEQELFSMDELIAAFSIERVGKAGTRFDIEKAKWFNQQYLRAKPDAELSRYVLDELAGQGIACSGEKAEKIVRVMKERATFPRELWSEAMYFFEPPATYEPAVVQSKWNSDAARIIGDFRDALTDAEPFTSDTIKSTLNGVLERHGVKIGKVLQALRLTVTGVGHGPDLMQIMEILGKEETTRRISQALNTLKS
jgi:glutamyl-tRNA synthetase